jgi:hypothetical protein
MPNSPELRALIRKNASLFWYTKDNQKEDLELPIVVEFFLNYAQLEDVYELFRIVGIDEVARVFRGQIGKSERSANNYLPISRNYFDLYFLKHAS